MCTHVCANVLASFMPRKKAGGENLVIFALSLILEFFFLILTPQIKYHVYCKLLLCTVMHLLPSWLLFKHLTTVIVLYINHTPWWLLYYLYPKWCLQILAAWLLVLLTISALCQHWFGDTDAAWSFLCAFVTRCSALSSSWSLYDARAGLEVCASDPYDEGSLLQTSICIQLDTRAKAVHKWFVKKQA